MYNYLKILTIVNLNIFSIILGDAERTKIRGEKFWTSKKSTNIKPKTYTLKKWPTIHIVSISIFNRTEGKHQSLPLHVAAHDIALFIHN
jgi:hypothetical protein